MRADVCFIDLRFRSMGLRNGSLGLLLVLLLAARVSSRSQRALVVISGRCDERIVSLRTRSQPFLSQRSKNVQGRRVTRTSSEDGHLHFSCLPAFCVIVSVESRSLCTKSKYRHSRLNHHNR